MRKKSRNLGWIGYVAAVVWLYYDYAGQRGRAIIAGWVTLGFTTAHILTARSRR